VTGSILADNSRLLNERDKQHLEAAQMRFLGPLLGYLKLDLKRNVDIRE
jgi:hypothetical protein